MKVFLLLAFVATSAVALHFENECPKEQEENWEIELLLRHPDCDKFYKCTFGVPIETQCPAGLYFNLDYWQCDWKENVDCTDRNVPGEEPVPQPTPEPTPETTPKPTPEPTPEPTTQTTPKPTPEPTPEPTTVTTPKPTPEPTTVTTPKPTPEPTPEPTTVTTPKPTPEPTPETTPKPAPTPQPEPDFLENGCPVNPHIHWLLPHELDCNLFYYCVWGKKVQRECPSSLHFNRVIQVCDWPQSAGCPTSFNKHINLRLNNMRLFQLNV